MYNSSYEPCSLYESNVRNLRSSNTIVRGTVASQRKSGFEFNLVGLVNSNPPTISKNIHFVAGYTGKVTPV